MSDYEGEDWDHVDLYINRSIGPTSEIFTDHVAPKGQSSADLALESRVKLKSSKNSSQPGLAESFYPVIQSIHPKTRYGTGGRPVRHNTEVHSNRSRLEAFKRHSECPTSPDHVYELQQTWKDFISKLPEFDTSPEEIAQNRLDNICMASEAFINPREGTNKLEIWGTEEQCRDAEVQLKAWESHVRAPIGRNRNAAWHKQLAYDGRQEHRQIQNELKRYELDELQRADDRAFDFEAYLIWPSGYDLDAYLRQYETTILEAISRTFRCRFSHRKDERHGASKFTKVQAETEQNLLAAYQRLVNLVKEMVAQKNKGTHGNFFRLPSAETYRDSVVVESDMSTSTYLVTLTGNPFSEEDSGEWSRLARIMELRNRKEIRNSLDTFIKTLHVSQSHIRLRVDFGELGLTSFMKPNSGSNVFKIDDFLDMINNPRTVLSDCLLRIKDGDMHELVDVIGNMEEFDHPEDAYRLLFDFQGTDRASRLRLETEMQPGFDFDEPSICAQRWLISKGSRNSENILGIKVLDLDRPGYMIRADTFDIFTNEAATRDMTAFQSVISFKPSRDGLKAIPKRRAVFPPGKPDLTYVTEITSKKFRFKQTDGTLELRREDVYDQRNGHASTFPTSSHWAASYYYYEWDNLMGEFANVHPGEQVKWPRELSTFFPETIDEDFPKSLPRGFKTFMREVAEIQELLAKALSKLPKVVPMIQGGRIVGGRTAPALRTRTSQRN